jgi:hypothetical protein
MMVKTLDKKSTPPPQRMHSGIYAVSLRRWYETSPWFYDWLNLESPYVGQVIELYKEGGEQAIIAAISGTPPFGGILCVGLPNQKVKSSQSLVNNRYAQVIVRAYAESIAREPLPELPNEAPELY